MRTQPPRNGQRLWRRADIFGLAWVVAALLAYFAPALWDGFSFGPADIGHQLSYLTYVPTHLPYLGVHNHLNGDIITQEVPWDTLDWLAAHHWQLPLWNPYSGLGMPLMFNWESAPFALPTLIGYLFPLAASYLAAVLSGLLVAGTGTYFATRLAGAGPLGSAFAGSTFMLSGPISGWAGWAVGRPLVWAGWLLGGVLLCWRPGHRLAGVALVAVSSAFAVYGGFPETLALLAWGAAVIVFVGAIATKLTGRRGQLEALARVAAGLLGGAALSAPLWLPGAQVLSQSARAGEAGGGALAVRSAALVLAQGYDGLPTKTSTWFGPSNYYESAAYVGAAGLALALTAVALARRRPLVLALASTAVLSGVAVYTPAGEALLSALGLGAIAPARALSVAAFCIAVLSGLGLSDLARRWGSLELAMALLGSAALGLAGVAYLWFTSGAKGLTPAEVSIRHHALTWPALTLAGAALAALAAFSASAPRAPKHIALPAYRNSRRAGLYACLAMLGAQSAYLVWAGTGLNSYSSTPFPQNRAVAQLQRLVGHSLVALDGPNSSNVTEWTGTGLYPEVNVGYQVRELAVHDPAMPSAYFKTWPVPKATAAAGPGNNVFVPSVSTAALARWYGARFILASKGRVPAGATFVSQLGTPPYALYLYSVPGAAQFSFSAGATARVLSARQTGDASWRLSVTVHQAAALTLRVTYMPGWHVLADGRALVPHEEDGLFLGVTVPAGTRSVVLTYWPRELSVGFALALGAIAALLGAIVFLSAPWARREPYP
ncbi:MAG: YfhO family protein [Acidimicrobiales bacterium]